jgi:hypothetical protein
VLAAALAVGLGGLLVGLSIAPRLLPSDTIRVRLRVAVAASIDHKAPADFLAAAATVAGAGTHGIAVAAVVVSHVIAHRMAWFTAGSHAAAVVVDQAVRASVCRGPPVGRSR